MDATVLSAVRLEVLQGGGGVLGGDEALAGRLPPTRVVDDWPLVE